MPQANSSAAVATDKQIAQYAYNAGWRGDNLIISVAVALAESGGRVGVVNYLGCTGLWQVYARVHGLSIERLKDPQYNAQQAYKIWQKQGWRRGWTTYSHGTHNRFMARARAATGNISSTTPTNPSSGLVGQSPTTGELSAAFDKLTSRDTWIRIFMIWLGVLLIAIALIRITVKSDVAKAGASVAGTAVQFIPGGGLVKTGVKAVASGKPSAVVKSAKGIGKAVNSAKAVAKG